MALTTEFSGDGQKQLQWNAFKKKNRLTEPMGGLEEVVRELKARFQPTLKCMGVLYTA